jgi:putative membrane protein
MSALFAFLHHLAAFVLFAALVVEMVLLKDELTIPRAQKIALADMILGIAAGVLLVVGLLRVFYFEKGAAYYFHSIPFLVKLSLFILVALASIYPTVKFLSWRSSINRGQAPILTAGTRRSLRLVIHAELTGIVVILLCAALMARGIGSM